MKYSNTACGLSTASRAEKVVQGIGRFFFYWLPPLIWSGGILFMASDHGSFQSFGWLINVLKALWPQASMAEIYQLYGILRKVLHFLVYASLLGVYVRALWGHLGLRRWPALLLSLLICLVIASADEARQAFYPSRQGRPSDVLLDMSGAVSATLILLPFLREPEPDHPERTGS